MNDFIEQLIMKLEKYKTCAYVTGITNNPYEFGACDAMNSAIRIVKETEEEYKKEWSKDYGWKLTKRFIEEKYFKRIYEISEKYDYPCENIALDMNWMFGLIEKIENKFTEEYKPRTNADKVRNMNETQLSNLISSACPYEYCYQTDDTTCDLCILEWLHSEVKDGE